MKIVDITACIRVTKENDMHGMEYYIDIGSKVKITFTDGKTLVGYVPMDVTSEKPTCLS